MVRCTTVFSLRFNRGCGFSYNIILDAFPARCGGEMPAIFMGHTILDIFCADLFSFCVVGELTGLVGPFYGIDVIYGHVRCICEAERERWEWGRNMG